MGRPGLQRSDGRLLVDRGDCLVVGHVQRQMRHVSCRTIGELGDNLSLMRLPRRAKNNLLRTQR